MPTKAKTFIALAIVPGLMMLALGISHWESDDPVRFTIYLLLALIASTLKVRLPGLTGTMSLNFLFILIGVSQLSFSEMLTLGAVATVTQCVWKTRVRRSEEHTSELQSRGHLVCRLLLEKKKKKRKRQYQKK